MWVLDKSRPIISQICEHICVLISNGELEVDSKIYSVRELALKLGVNPNTVQKSFELLEKEGIIRSIRGSGWYVNDNKEVAIKIVSSLCEKKTKEYLMSMKKLGCTYSEIVNFIKEKEGDLNG